MPARSDLRIWRFINITSNLSSLMGKLCQHLIKAKCTAALCQQEALSLSSAVSRKLVPRANENTGSEFCISRVEFGFQTSSKGPLSQTGLKNFRPASPCESTCLILQYPSECNAPRETMLVPSKHFHEFCLSSVLGCDHRRIPMSGMSGAGCRWDKTIVAAIGLQQEGAEVELLRKLPLSLC